MKRALLIFAALACSSGVFADTVAWDATGNNLFGSLDLTTGAFNEVSNLGFTPAGLGQIGSTIYTANSGGMSLYSIDTQTGAVKSIGTSSISYYAFGSTTSGLYMVDTVGGLWNINPTTGTSTLIGSTHLLMGSNTVGLSAGSNNLYIALGSNIYIINTTTGNASFLGNSGSTDFGALVSVSGTVYASTIVSPNAIYNFNPMNGISTFATLSSASDYSYGLAPIVPEPSSFALLALVGSLLAGYVVWKRKRAAQA
jgi:PEP-CTERM motif